MRIYHLSSAPVTGGAARAGLRLHQGFLQEAGVESQWLGTGKQVPQPGVVALPTPASSDALGMRLRRRHWSKAVSRHFGSVTTPASNPVGWGAVEMLCALPVPDVWNLHWVSWLLNWETMLPWMAERAPIVWTLHDLNPLMGIWHYEPMEEERTPQRTQLEQEAVDLKRRALARIPADRLTFVGPSRWMAERCRQSPITRDFPVTHIPYGLDTEVFSPRDRSVLRLMFGIPHEAFVIGFIADNLNDPRKGIRPLQEALKLLAKEHPEAHLVTVGNGAIDSGGLVHTHLGPLQNDLLLSHFYSTCDVFVCPSLQDNLPNTVLESLACDTPVVAFRTGGLPDMVEREADGYLVESVGDVEGLYAALQKSMTARAVRPQDGQCSRTRAAQKYSLSTQSRNYLELYQSQA